MPGSIAATQSDGQSNRTKSGCGQEFDQIYSAIASSPETDSPVTGTATGMVETIAREQKDSFSGGY